MKVIIRFILGCIFGFLLSLTIAWQIDINTREGIMIISIIIFGVGLLFVIYPKRIEIIANRIIDIFRWL